MSRRKAQALLFLPAMLALEDRKLKRAKEQDADGAEDVDGDDKPTGVMNAMHNNIDNSEVCAQ